MSTYLQFPDGYQNLRALSQHSPIFLCREDASSRLVVMKFIPNRKRELFEREVAALMALEDLGHCPRLYFAKKLKLDSNDPEALNFVIAMQYIAGKSLLDASHELSNQERAKIFTSAKEAIMRLHQKYGYAHGDLSPKNILIRPDNATSRGSSIYFIDWEFSEKLSTHTLSHYNQYRGTMGFTKQDSWLDPAQKDLEALKACEKFNR